MHKRSVQKTAVGEHFQIDLITDLPASNEGYNCLLLCVCETTHFMIGIPLCDQTSPSNSAVVQGIFKSSLLLDLFPVITKPLLMQLRPE